MHDGSEAKANKLSYRNERISPELKVFQETEKAKNLFRCFEHLLTTENSFYSLISSQTFNHLISESHLPLPQAALSLSSHLFMSQTLISVAEF